MKQRHFEDRAAFRAWLTKNHDRERELWLIFHKTHTGKTNIPLEDAIEEAICFGWVDSLIKRIDDDRYARKFTPRKEKSAWNERNHKRAQKMIKAGLMTDIGLAKLKSGVKAKERSTVRAWTFSELPEDIKQALNKNAQARKHFPELKPRYLSMCLDWINFAKRPETRLKRIHEFVELTAKNERIGMK